MKTLKFSDKSWHYRFIKKYTDRADYDMDNICAYTRGFIQACLIVLLILAAVTLVSFLLTQILVGVAFSLWYGMFIFSEPAIIAMIVIAVMSIAIGGIAGHVWLKERRYEKRRALREAGVEEVDGFMTNAYKSWKEKWCARVEIVRPEYEEGPAEL